MVALNQHLGAVEPLQNASGRPINKNIPKMVYFIFYTYNIIPVLHHSFITFFHRAKLSPYSVAIRMHELVHSPVAKMCIADKKCVGHTYITCWCLTTYGRPGSNRGPPAPKAGMLPLHHAHKPTSLYYIYPTGVEPVTLALSGQRSNRLSYIPLYTTTN